MAAASRVIAAPHTQVYAALVDEACFVEVVADVRDVQAVTSESDDAAFAGTMTMTWEVTPVNGGTRVDISADHVPDGISAEDHARGLTSSLENLATYLAGAASTTGAIPNAANRRPGAGQEPNR